MRWACSTHGIKNEYKIFIGRSEGKRPRGRSRSRWGNIRMDLRETGSEGAERTHLNHVTDR
jgi:hypothetical protein